MDQSKLIEQLFAEIKQLKERMSVLEKENTVLRQKLSKYENPKNSRNSSIPPSKDENRPLKTKSLREPTDRKVGGQKGHEGSTLKMTENPDKIMEYVPDFCCECGHDLQGVTEEFVGKRQVVDIPIIKPQYVEHRIYRRTCNCGHLSCASYPKNVNASISYGANTESLVGYLYSRQYVPFHRMREFLMMHFLYP